MEPKVDVLKPELLWFGTRCYRKIPVRQVLQNPDKEDLYPEEESKKPWEEINDIPIKRTNEGFFSTILIPKTLEQRLKRECAFIQKSLRAENIRMNCPKVPGNVDTLELTITSPSKRGVYEASRRINVFIESSRLRTDFTHFISVPMNFENIQNSFLQFKEDVMRTCKGVRGLDESIFQDPGKLHLTVVPLVLLNSHERSKAMSTLHKSKDEVMEIMCGEPLSVMVKGIEYMNDDPEEVDVLYAKIESDEDACLQRISDLLLKKFDDAKVSTKHDNYVKLHITLLNTLFRRRPEESSGSRAKRETFDARKILEQYGDYEFGMVTVSEVHLSQRYSTGEDGYYVPTFVLPLSNKKPGVS